MKASVGKYLLVLLCVLVLPLSCARKGRVLSERKMASLYVDMFLADQWLRNNTELRKTADTTDFFAPVFKKHHCSFEDYDASLRYYSANPTKFSEVMTLACNTLKAESERLSELSGNIIEANRINKENAAKRSKLDFDTVYLWRSAKDSLAAVSDSIAAVKDSAAMHPDSLAVAPDSLSAAPDSLIMTLDSIAKSPAADRMVKPMAGRGVSSQALKKVGSKKPIRQINKDNQ
ncbi:MAG: DUF4296 domain-containing protein [Candidatus Cryptobacteroides sp.]